MILEIKNRIESELAKYLKHADKLYHLRQISPLLYNHIRDFVARDGKRVRPILFCIGYLGFAKKQASGLYFSAISIELLHDFMLIHDDIIDKSPTRRGKPSMHESLNKYLRPFKGIKFSGEDLSIVAGDIIYAMALGAFLNIKEKPLRKEKALQKFIEAALYTGCGEFTELILGTKGLERVKKEEIYKIYDLKTANYTFAYPLAIGATLAGANQKQIQLLFKYGNCLGRAFQIKDDIQGIFNEESEIGKSNLTDLQEAKKTILIWKAFRNSDNKNKKAIKEILSKKDVTRHDLINVRKIISASGSLEYAKKEIADLQRKSDILLTKCSIKNAFKDYLQNFSRKILNA